MADLAQHGDPFELYILARHPPAAPPAAPVTATHTPVHGAPDLPRWLRARGAGCRGRKCQVLEARLGDGFPGEEEPAEAGAAWHLRLPRPQAHCPCPALFFGSGQGEWGRKGLCVGPSAPDPPQGPEGVPWSPGPIRGCAPQRRPVITLWPQLYLHKPGAPGLGSRGFSPQGYLAPA